MACCFVCLLLCLRACLLACVLGWLVGSLVCVVSLLSFVKSCHYCLGSYLFGWLVFGFGLCQSISQRPASLPVCLSLFVLVCLCLSVFVLFLESVFLFRC